jgi:hypothetical protein
LASRLGYSGCRYEPRIPFVARLPLLVPGLEPELDRLFGLPLTEFTSARNELARRLKSAGDSAEAERVRALAKPSVAAWAVNQLSRQESGPVKVLLDVGDALRGAQKQLLQGAGSADSVRNLRAKEREAIELLTSRARDLIESAGRPPTEAMLERVSRTLQAAAVDDEGRRLLKAGRLIGELEPVGFEAFGGPVAARERSVRARDERAEDRREQEDRRRRRRELQQGVQELERAARKAERDADRKEDAATNARRVAVSARAAADKAAEELERL